MNHEHYAFFTPCGGKKGENVYIKYPNGLKVHSARSQVDPFLYYCLKFEVQ